MQLLLLSVSSNLRFQKVTEQLTAANNQLLLQKAKERVLGDLREPFKAVQKGSAQDRDTTFRVILNSLPAEILGDYFALAAVSLAYPQGVQIFDSVDFRRADPRLGVISRDEAGLVLAELAARI